MTLFFFNIVEKGMKMKGKMVNDSDQHRKNRTVYPVDSENNSKKENKKRKGGGVCEGKGPAE